MASFRAYFNFKKREPEKVAFKASEKKSVILKIEKKDFQPLKMTVKH
jgi:hypothetical protein